jgi:hypothetical protein
MEALLHKAELIRRDHIEMYAAAFLREVGAAEASQYVLVERHENKKITWSFERNDTTKI